MTRTRIALALAAAAAIAGGVIYQFSQPSVPYIDPADQQAVARGKDIYAAQCAACHGAKLEGQPEWRKRLPNGRLPAPPHDETGHTWHHPDAVLVDIVKHGLVPGRTAPEGYQSDMPAYAKTLSDENTVAVLAYIKSTWPKEVRAQQKEMTLNQARR